MRFLGNPFVWLMRIRNRKGYGVHSPFAFSLITEVIYEDAPYYDFGWLDSTLPWTYRFRKQKGYHLLLRLANWYQPDLMSFLGMYVMEWDYFCCGSAHARRIEDYPDSKEKCLIFTDRPDDGIIPHLHKDTMLILDNLHLHRAWFNSLPSVVTFDLYDMGIAFFDPQYHKHNYIVNF